MLKLHAEAAPVPPPTLAPKVGREHRADDPEVEPVSLAALAVLSIWGLPQL